MARPRLIDDSRLTELYKTGATYREIGKQLNVSAVAVHKRLKRLGLLSSLDKLTVKARNFVIGVASGQSRTAAVMSAYDVTSRDSAKSLQTALMKDPDIRLAIDDLLEQKGMGREYRVEKLKQHLENPDPVISLKSLDMGFKLANDYPPQRNLNMEITAAISPIDISKYLIRPKDEDSVD